MPAHKKLELRKASAIAPGGGKNTGELVRATNKWRDAYNPLRGLVIARVIAILEQAERGDFAELQMVLRKVEKRFPVLKALKARRLSALERLDWDVKILSNLPERYTKADAEKQQKFLRARYDQISNLREAIGFLVMAEFRGYSILQKRRPDDGAVKELYWLPQYNFCRAGSYGDFFWNRDASIGIGGDGCLAVLGEKNRIGSEELPREEFVIRECADDINSPLFEIAPIAFVNWSMGRKDWSAFVEIFGLPNSVVIMPGNIPAGKESDYEASAVSVANGVSGALPAGSDVKFPGEGVRADAPFNEFCSANVADVVLAGTGGLLTMLALPTGIGGGASEQHGDAFDDIAQADALKISETLQRDFDKQELAAQFPGQPSLAYFELASPDREDVTAFVGRVGTLASVGLFVSDADVSERTGLKLTRAEAPRISPLNGRDAFHRVPEITNREELTPPPETPTAEQEFFLALADDLAPLRSRLNEILSSEDDLQLEEKLRQFAAELDGLKKDLTADPASARALEKVFAQAFAEGAGMQPKEQTTA